MPSKTCLGLRSDGIRHEIVGTIVFHLIDFARQEILNVMEISIVSSSEYDAMPSLYQTADGLQRPRYVGHFDFERSPGTFASHDRKEFLAQIGDLVPVRNLIANSSCGCVASRDFIVTANLRRHDSDAGSTVKDSGELFPLIGQRP